MAKPPKVRFGVEHSGRRRAIMSVEERPTGDLIIDIRARGRRRAAGVLISEPSDDPQHGAKIEEFRYSIHPSLESETGISTIKLTTTVEGADSETRVLYTPAIKGGGGFSPVFVRRATNFDDEIYNATPGAKYIEVSIAQVANDFTLFWGLFVGTPGQEFDVSVPGPYQYRQWAFGPARLIILYSFLAVTAHEGSAIVSTYSLPGGRHEPWSPEHCVDWFFRQCEMIKGEMLETIAREPHNEKGLPKAAAMAIATQAPFFREARYDTAEHHAWWKEMQRQGHAADVTYPGHEQFEGGGFALRGRRWGPGPVRPRA
jgi:hypothetical protein